MNMEMNLQKSKVLIIIPAFNEAENIEKVLTDVKGVAGEISIAVINDCSSDNTPALAKRMGVHVINLPCNLGYGGSVQTGFKYAVSEGYDYCVQIDGDGQHDPKSIMDLLNVVQSGEADVAIGSRFLGSVQYKVPFVRRLGMKLFGKLVSLIIKQDISDPTSGYQALNRDVLQFYAYDNYPTDYPDADTFILLHYAGFKVKEVPVTMRDRQFGTAMHTNLKSFYYVYKMFLAIGILLLRKNELRGMKK